MVHLSLLLLLPTRIAKTVDLMVLEGSGVQVMVAPPLSEEMALVATALTATEQLNPSVGKPDAY